MEILVFLGNGKEIDTTWREISSSTLEFAYFPERAGLYNIKVMWNSREISGRFSVVVTTSSVHKSYQ